MSCRPPTRSRGSTAMASTMIPMPPSHCVNWRHIRVSGDRVEVRDDARACRRESGHALEVRVERARELVAALEEVRDRGERGRRGARSARRRGTLADADLTGRVAVSRSSPNPTPLVTDAGDDERQERLSVPDRDGIGKSAASPRYFPSIPTRLGGRIDRQPPRAADPRRGLGHITAPRRPRAVRRLGEDDHAIPRLQHVVPCGKIAVPSRTTAPMIGAPDGHFPERLADVAARFASRHVEHLVPIVLDHRDLLRPGIVGEPTISSAVTARGSIDDVIPAFSKTLYRHSLVSDRNGEPHPVHLRERMPRSGSSCLRASPRSPPVTVRSAPAPGTRHRSPSR